MDFKVTTFFNVRYFENDTTKTYTNSFRLIGSLL